MESNVFYDWLEQKTKTVAGALCKYFEVKDNRQRVIYEAMEYSLMAGGKRMRPIISLAAAELFGDSEPVLPFACAIEMIHTYSLIHDDLPCMDNDDLRRGKPTNHIVYGEAMALLAGDGLLNGAFETVLRYAKTPANITLDALKVIAELSGTEGMIGGQVIDIISENKEIDSVTVMTMYLNKTAALIMAAAKVGAIVGGAMTEDVQKMEEFARYLGIAFQIKDDILDIEGSEEIFGKPIGSDEENKKTTMVSLYGIDESKQMLNDYTMRAVEIAQSYGAKGDMLRELALFLLSRNK